MASSSSVLQRGVAGVLFRMFCTGTTHRMISVDGLLIMDVVFPDRRMISSELFTVLGKLALTAKIGGVVADKKVCSARFFRSMYTSAGQNSGLRPAKRIVLINHRVFAFVCLLLSLPGRVNFGSSITKRPGGCSTVIGIAVRIGKGGAMRKVGGMTMLVADGMLY